MADTDGSVMIQWHKGDIMPQQLIDVLEASSSSASSSSCETDNTPDDEECEVEEDCEVDNMLDIVFEEDED